jgi:hypothetical protein
MSTVFGDMGITRLFIFIFHQKEKPPHYARRLKDDFPMRWDWFSASRTERIRMSPKEG